MSKNILFLFVLTISSLCILTPSVFADDMRSKGAAGGPNQELLDDWFHPVLCVNQYDNMDRLCERATLCEALLDYCEDESRECNDAADAWLDCLQPRNTSFFNPNS